MGAGHASALRTRLVNGFEHFIDVRGMSDREVAQWLRTQEIDIAVDLKGYTYDARLGILAQRPAPVQVTYLGFPGTLGATYIDYLVADEVVVPLEARAHYAEQVVYLPDSYQVNDGKRTIAARTPTRAELGLPERGFVFCSFNNNYKITPEVFDVWMRLLRQVEGSVLWLLEGNATAPANLRREAQARGVAGERLVFAPRLPLAEHLARQRLADLFLDTLPCNAHTTASDALWAGLPVLTCLGGDLCGAGGGKPAEGGGVAGADHAFAGGVRGTGAGAGDAAAGAGDDEGEAGSEPADPAFVRCAAVRTPSGGGVPDDVGAGRAR